jgi:hypothetical protein
MRRRAGLSLAQVLRRLLLRLRVRLRAWRAVAAKRAIRKGLAHME